MCGIVGYIGKNNAVEIILEGLKRLEYRGYDSAGIAVLTGNGISVVRCAGKLANLSAQLARKPVSGNLGVGHTRWATHGKPSEENAHPHMDCKNKIVVVHNGIIENFMELKKELTKEGHRFSSETDTEVIVHLIEKYYDGRDLFAAVFRATKKLAGAYALGIISADEPDKLVAVRKDSPLVVGIGKDRQEFFIASDVPALLPYTKNFIFLEDDEFAVLTPPMAEIINSKGRKVSRQPVEISWDPIMAEKGGYKHFMLKEIFEQPASMRDTLRGRILNNDIYLEDLSISDNFLKRVNKIFILACGTSYHAGLIGKFLIEGLVRLPVEVDIASEFRYRQPVINPGSLVIAITQSGETADTLAAMRLSKKAGATTLTICNVVGSTATREADGIIYTHCGPEIGVASTKAFTGQLVTLFLLAFYLAKTRKTIPQKRYSGLIKELLHIPQLSEAVLKKSRCIRELAGMFYKKSDFLYLGRGINYPVALEGALKLKEISYIHAEGYPAGEMKHGPIALIDENMPVVAIATGSPLLKKIISNIQEAKTRNGITIGITTRGDKIPDGLLDYVIDMPAVEEIFTPVLNVIPLQLLAYYIADIRGCDVDQPRNLAKSVTVE
ncbi:MAG: glutamine--fructose-6-phosphate transaminase (isomerizing) [Elusimicrobiota bacterium]